MEQGEHGKEDAGGGGKARPEDVVDEVLSRARAREGSAFSEKTYTGEPILRTGAEFKRSFEAREHGGDRGRGPSSRARRAQTAERQLPLRPDGAARGGADGIPTTSSEETARDPRRDLQPVLQELRAREQGRGGGHVLWAETAGEEAALFLEQARIAEGFTDDAPYLGIVPYHRHATYEALADDELRGYFTWRGRWLAGEAGRIPNVYARIRAAEIANGVGVESPATGLGELLELRKRGAELDETGMGPHLNASLSRWALDYALVNDLDAGRLVDEDERSFAHAVAVLRRAEECALDGAGSMGGARLPEPSEDVELWGALCRVAGYPPEKSPFLRSHGAEAQAAGALLFAEMARHFSQHGSRGLVDSLVGEASSWALTPFLGLPYAGGDGHADAAVRLTDAQEAVCEGGLWRMKRGYGSTAPCKWLANVLRALDRQMRIDWGFGKPLKERPLPAWLAEAVARASSGARARAEEEAARAAEEAARVEAERRRISFDFSKLGRIRADAAETREALLVDEEMGDEPEEPQAVPAVAPGPDADENPCGLDELELAVLGRIACGEGFGDLLGPGAPMESVLVDSINEKLFDGIGDAVVEFDGEGRPRLVEDYAEDVRALIGAES